MPTQKTGPAASLADEAADLVFKALASKTRREILTLLASGAGDDDDRCCGADRVCACVFAERLGLGAPTVSHHMKVLLDASLVSADKRGSWVYYQLRPETFEFLARELERMAGCARSGCS